VENVDRRSWIMWIGLHDMEHVDRRSQGRGECGQKVSMIWSMWTESFNDAENVDRRSWIMWISLHDMEHVDRMSQGRGECGQKVSMTWECGQKVSMTYGMWT